MTRILVTVLILALSPTALSARTWYIKSDGTGDAPTIQAGVDSAAAGDTVLVAPGTYTHKSQVTIFSEIRTVNVHILKNILLIGEDTNTTIILRSASNIGIYASYLNDSTLIRGFTIKSINSYKTAWDGLEPAPEFPFRTKGIFCYRAPIRIDDCKITEYEDAIVCMNDSDAEITNCLITGNSRHFYCIASSPCISDCRFFYSIGGLFFDDLSNPTLIGNYITSGEQPFLTYGPPAVFCQSSATIENNIFPSSSSGIWFDSIDSSPNIIRNNLFSGTSPAIYANTPNALIENNTFEWTLHAIVYFGYPNTIIRNNIIINSVGIRCVGELQAEISCNNIYNIYGGDRYDNCPDQTGINGNISVDPEFCGIHQSFNFYLQSDSPCAPGNHPDGYDCGLIGAFPVNCGLVDVKKKSLGSIKALFE